MGNTVLPAEDPLSLIAAVQFSLIQTFRNSDFQKIKSNRLSDRGSGSACNVVFTLDGFDGVYRESFLSC